MILADICVRRPVFATMLVGSLVVAGWFSYKSLTLDLFPKVDMPVVTVTTTLPGAGPEEMEAQVTKPIEEVINTVSGIGPKIALNILSGISVTGFRGAVANGDIKALSQISGVGKKTAERIIVELKDKVGAAGAWEALSAKRALSPEDQKVNDAVLALVALGFKQIEAHDSVRKALSTLGAQATIEELVRACLKKSA